MSSFTSDSTSSFEATFSEVFDELDGIENLSTMYEKFRQELLQRLRTWVSSLYDQGIKSRAGGKRPAPPAWGPVEASGESASGRKFGPNKRKERDRPENSDKKDD